MKNKYVFVTVLLLVMALAGLGFVRSYVALEGQRNEEELLIVTSFYPMYVATINVAAECENVTVENLSEPQTGCLHDYQLTPQDMILLSEADVFVVNGGGIEKFLTEVAEEFPQLTIIDAGAGIFGAEGEHREETPEHGHDHGENAHAWMSIPYYMEQVSAISEGLSAADEVHRTEYEAGAAAYLEKIQEVYAESLELAEETEGYAVILLHEAFVYLAEDYGMTVAGELNLDEERQVSAGEVADVLYAIEEKNVRILLAEELYGKALGDTIEAETDCRVYYLDTLVRGRYDRDSWLSGMRNNIALLREAFYEAKRE